jgi:hypothetical protein
MSEIFSCVGITVTTDLFLSNPSFPPMSVELHRHSKPEERQKN